MELVPSIDNGSHIKDVCMYLCMCASCSYECMACNLRIYVGYVCMVISVDHIGMFHVQQPANYIQLCIGLHTDKKIA